MSYLAGLNEVKSKETVDGLNTFLGSLFTVYVKVLNFHWNIKGRRFAPLHEFLAEQYKFLAETADEVAERIRVFDAKAPGSMEEFLSLSKIKESKDAQLTADEMLDHLSADYGTLIEMMRDNNDRVPDNDYGTHTLYEDLITQFEKTRWMIKSHLK